METLVALGIAIVVAAAVVGGATTSLRSSEYTTFAVAAHASAVQRLEQARGMKWDAVTYPIVDELVASNFPPQAVMLDVPGSGTNVLWGTNFTTISTISTNPWLKLIRVDCVYRPDPGRLATNSIVSYRAAETGQQNIVAFSPPASSSLPPTGGTTSTSNPRSTSDEDDDDGDDDDGGGGGGDD